MRVALIQCDWVLIKGDILTKADTEGGDGRCRRSSMWGQKNDRGHQNLEPAGDRRTPGAFRAQPCPHLSVHSRLQKWTEQIQVVLCHLVWGPCYSRPGKLTQRDRCLAGKETLKKN